MTRIFILSPASCSGRRAGLLLAEGAMTPLAQRLRKHGAPLGEAFTFLSGLYFRGKLTYAQTFARPPADLAGEPAAGIHVITPSAGLRTPDTLVTVGALRRFASVDISADNQTYRRPLEASAWALCRALDPDTGVVLLGSIATPKYLAVLQGAFGDRLLFPPAFVGRGDMSRGGLLLRAAACSVELDYVPVAGAVRHGSRPPKLAPL
jgi:hypothetical protein